MNYRDLQFGFWLIFAPICAVAAAFFGAPTVDSLPSAAANKEGNTSCRLLLQEGRCQLDSATASASYQLSCYDTEPPLRSGGRANGATLVWPPKKNQTKVCCEISFHDLLSAIVRVESRGLTTAEGDGGSAIGAYQLRPIYVDDVNRILRFKRYSLEDRYSKQKSREITKVYLRYWGRINSDYISLDQAVKLARIHNGGPSGHKKKSTAAYGRQIRSILLGGDGGYSDKSALHF